MTGLSFFFPHHHIVFENMCTLYFNSSLLFDPFVGSIYFPNATSSPHAPINMDKFFLNLCYAYFHCTIYGTCRSQSTAKRLCCKGNEENVSAYPCYYCLTSELPWTFWFLAWVPKNKGVEWRPGGSELSRKEHQACKHVQVSSSM